MHIQNKLKLKDILETDNLLSLLKDVDKDTIANEVTAGYDSDCQSMGEWRDKAERYLKFANCDVKDRSVPWPGASNLCLPVIANACIASASRLYAELLRTKYPAETYVYGQNDVPNLRVMSNIMKEHILYQLRVDPQCNWEEDLYTLCYLYYVVGTVPRHKYYDETENAYKFKTLWPDQWAISAAAADIESSRFSFVDRMYLCTILDKINSGEFESYKYIEDLDLETEDLYEEREIVKQFVKLDLDGDGYAEPYCVIVDRDAGELLKLTKNFFIEENDIPPKQDEITGAVIEVGRKESPQIEYKANGDPKKVKELTPIPYVTVYRMQDTSEATFFKHGLAHRLYPLNKAANALTNQILDIGTLQARQGSYIDQRCRIPGGTKSLAMNQSLFIKPPPGMSIQQAVFPFPRNEISPVQFSMLEFIKTLGDETGNVTEIMSGQVPDNTSPMIGMAAIQNSLLPFKTTYRLFLTAYNKEIMSLGVMNYLYLDEAETFFLKDKQLGVSNEMYNPKVAKVIPVADPTVAADAERGFQQSVLDSMLDRPESNDRAILMRRLEEANIEEVERYLPPPNPNPPPAPEMIQMQAMMKALEAETNQKWEKIQLDKEKQDLAFKQAMHKMKQERLDIALKADKELSEQVERGSKSILNIAEAEAAEAGQQLAEYEAQVNKIRGEVTNARTTPDNGSDGIDTGRAEAPISPVNIAPEQDLQTPTELPGDDEQGGMGEVPDGGIPE